MIPSKEGAMMATTISITALDPKFAPPADTSIRAVVSLYWPYSSSTKQCALLLADPDFRLRSRRGQVRVRFTGSSATAVAQGKVGIGDEVVLKLKGARWAEELSGVSTPGKSVEGELVYNGQLDLLLVKKAGGSTTLDQSIRVDEATPPPENRTNLETPVTGLQSSVSRNRLSSIDLVPIYSSPAFVKRQRLSGERFVKEDVYDPFAEIERELQDEQPRKRQRISDVSSWRLADRSPNPVKHRAQSPGAAINGAFQHASTKRDRLESTTEGAAVNHDNAAGAIEGMSPGTPSAGGAPASVMPPPALPKLRLPEDPFIPTGPQEQQQSDEDGPSTPKLKPMPSYNLPLPSPFPNESVQPPFSSQTAVADALPFQAEDAESEESSDGSIQLEINPSIVALAKQSQQLADGKPVVTDTEMLDIRGAQEPRERDHEDDLALSTGIYADGTSHSDTGYTRSLTENISDTEEDEEMEELYTREIQKSAIATLEREGIKRHDWAATSQTQSGSQRRSEGPGRSLQSTIRSQPTPVLERRVDQDESEEKRPALAQQPTTTQHGAEGDTNDAVEELIEVVNRFTDKTPVSSKTLDQPTASPKLEVNDMVKSTKAVESDSGARRQHAPSNQRSQQAISSEEPVTRAKTPAPQHVQRLFGFGFGVHGTSDSPPRLTTSKPQAEKDRVMKRTYSSLFGFRASPSPEKKEVEPLMQPPSQTSKQLETAKPKEAGFGFVLSLPTEPLSAANDQSVADTDDVRGDARMIDRHFAAPAEALHPQAGARQSGAQQERSSESYADPYSTIALCDPPANRAPSSQMESRPEPLAAERPPGHSHVPEPVIAITGQHPEMLIDEPFGVQGTEDRDRNNDFELHGEEDAESPDSQSEKMPMRAQASISQRAVVDQSTSFPPIGSAPLQSLVSEQVVPPPTSTAPRRSQVEVIDLGSTDDESGSEPDSNDKGQKAMYQQSPDLSAVYNDHKHQSRAWSSSSIATQAPPTGDSVDVEMLDEDVDMTEGLAMIAETSQQDITESKADPESFFEEQMQAGMPQPPATPVVVAPSQEDSTPLTRGFAETYRYFSFQAITEDGQSVEQDSDDDGEEWTEKSLQNGQREPAVPATQPSERLTQTISEPVHSTQLAVPEASTTQVSFAYSSLKVNAPPSAGQKNELAPSHGLSSPAASQEPAQDQHAETQHRLESQPSRTQATALPPGVTIWPTPKATNELPQHVAQEAESKDGEVRKLRRNDTATATAPVRQSPRKLHEAGHLPSSEEIMPELGHQRRERTPDRRLSTTSSMHSSLLSPARKVPVRRSPRRLQTAAESQDLGDIEETESVPSQSLRARRSTRQLQAKVEAEEVKRQSITDEQNATRPETSTDKLLPTEGVSKTPKPHATRKSFGTKLGHVPDVISAWFSPRRSSRRQGDGRTEALDDAEPSRRGASIGLRTASAYYHPLSGLDKKLNPSSQSGIENTTDVLAVVVSETKTPELAKGGPKDYFTVFRVTDTSLGDDKSTLVEVFRPWHATLPVAQPGDVVLLRSFAVKSRKRQPYLLSTEQSAWLVWRYDSSGKAAIKTSPRRPSTGAREEVNGPPVEFGDEERKRAKELRAWWQGLAGVRAAGKG